MACENVHAKRVLYIQHLPFEDNSYANGDFFIQRGDYNVAIECCARIACRYIRVSHLILVCLR